RRKNLSRNKNLLTEACKKVLTEACKIFLTEACKKHHEISIFQGFSLPQAYESVPRQPQSCS
ncbi:MAG TPA: hypothetical protein PKL79_02335, partial [Rectinema sp.]|nr:hypothetical protein [Rectinema sp.]